LTFIKAGNEDCSIKAGNEDCSIELEIVEGGKWKQYYLEIARYLADYWNIIIIYQNQNIGTITVDKTDTIYTIKNKIVDYLQKMVDLSIIDATIHIPQLNRNLEQLARSFIPNCSFYDKWCGEGMPLITFNIVKYYN